MPQWVRTLDIKDSWEKSNDEEIPVYELAKEIASKLKEFHIEDDYELQEIIEDFEGLSEDKNLTFDEFNYSMNNLYDWADTPLDSEWNGKKNCWIKTF